MSAPTLSVADPGLARRFVRALRGRLGGELPAEVAQSAARHLADAVGVGLAASVSLSGRAWTRAAATWAQGGPSTVFGQRMGASSANAAMINGGLIHSLEFDDTHTGSIMHGSAVVAAASLACSEAIGAGGQSMLAAYARGYEALILLGLAAPGRFHATGFQASSVAGTMAAALVAAELHGLNEDETVNALGIALSQSAGVMEFLSNGSSVKSLNPGWAAHGGVIAAGLAEAGMTGPETSLDGRWGLFAQFCDDTDAVNRMSGLLDSIGGPWHMPDAAFKLYPCCHYLHPFIEAAGRLADSGVSADAITEIVCEVPSGAAPVICEPWEHALNPQSGHSARWSLPIVIAARFMEGKVDLSTFEVSASAAVRDLARRVRWVPLQGARFPERFEAVVRCTLHDGGVRTARIDDVEGNPSRPASAEKISAKFIANASRALDSGIVSRLESALLGLAERDTPVSEIGALLRSIRNTA